MPTITDCSKIRITPDLKAAVVAEAFEGQQVPLSIIEDARGIRPEADRLVNRCGQWSKHWDMYFVSVPAMRATATGYRDKIRRAREIANMPVNDAVPVIEELLGSERAPVSLPRSLMMAQELDSHVERWQNEADRLESLALELERVAKQWLLEHAAPLPHPEIDAVVSEINGLETRIRDRDAILRAKDNADRLRERCTELAEGRGAPVQVFNGMCHVKEDAATTYRRCRTKLDETLDLAAGFDQAVADNAADRARMEVLGEQLRQLRKEHETKLMAEDNMSWSL